MATKHGVALEAMTYRAGQRQPVDIEASVVRDGESAGTIRIRNVSVYGFMAESRAPLDIGEGILVQAGGGATPRAARIAWAWRGRIGGEFLTPLGDAELTALTASHATG